MTANILEGRPGPEVFGALLDRFDPDVVAVQELDQTSAAVLAERFVNHQLVPADDASGRGMAVRFDAEFGEIPMSGRAGGWTRFDAEDSSWSVAGVHLLNAIDFPWWASVKGRAAQLKAIRGWLDDVEGDPTVIAGDFNASPSWPAYKEMEAALTDLAAAWAAERGARAERTWAWRPGWPRMLRIDHIFGSGVTVSGVAVVPISGSDHHAVVADLHPA